MWRLLPGEDARRGFAAFWDGGGGLAVVKGYHMAEFALLFLLARLVLLRVGAGARASWLAAVVAVLYAITDEWHQTFVPDRGGTWVDVMIDAAGVALAALLLRRRRRSAPLRAAENAECPMP